MSQSGVGMAVAILRDAYPRADFPDRSVSLYASMLSDLDDLAVAEAVKRLVRRSIFLPTIAEIRREVAEEQVALPPVEEVWAMVLNYDPLPTEAEDALAGIGGRWAIRVSENLSILRSQFSKDYEARREHAIRHAAGATVERPQLEPPALAELEETTAMKPRPMMMRVLARMSGAELLPPTEDEKGDAIRVLEQGATDPDDPASDPLYAEAERVLAEAGK